MTRRNTIMLTALREMCAGKKITALDYAKRFDTTRLGARIYDLRQLAMKQDRMFLSTRNGVKISMERFILLTLSLTCGATKGANY